MQNVLTDSGVSGNRSRGAVIPFERTISVISNRLYLNALLETKRFEEYFGVAMNIIVSYHPFDFVKSVLAQTDREGHQGTKAYITSMANTANIQFGAQSAVSPQTVVSSVKLLKDCVVMIVKIAAHLMDGMDLLKHDRECIETFSKITSTMTALMM